MNQFLQKIVALFGYGCSNQSSSKSLQVLKMENQQPKSTSQVEPILETRHKVIASSFADPADIRGYKRAKAQGMSDVEAFKYGDNGIGKWGDDTTADIPMCALPPEDWEPLGASARGTRVSVSTEKANVICELRDTMPHKRNIKNGCGIDLNPAACAALGLRIPVRANVIWQFVK